MSIDEALHYSPQLDMVEGFSDLGAGKRSKKIASHALVFMVRGMFWLNYTLSIYCMELIHVPVHAIVSF